MSDTIFLVSIDETPAFYCKNLKEAQDHAMDYLRDFPHYKDRRYYLDVGEMKFSLSSSYNFFFIQYEAVETVVNIFEISYRPKNILKVTTP